MAQIGKIQQTVLREAQQELSEALYDLTYIRNVMKGGNLIVPAFANCQKRLRDAAKLLSETSVLFKYYRDARGLIGEARQIILKISEQLAGMEEFLVKLMRARKLTPFIVRSYAPKVGGLLDEVIAAAKLVDRLYKEIK